MADIKIIDYGSQYTHLIKCRFRELGYDADVLAPDDEKALEGAKALVLSGGPKSVYEKGAPQLNKTLIKLMWEAGLPTLAICYGMQLICQYLAENRGYSAVKSGSSNKKEDKAHNEYGKAVLHITCEEKIFKNVTSGKVVWMSHGDYVDALPPNSHLLASTKTLRNAAIALIDRPVYMLQFHPEVTHTQEGEKILQNFLNISEISPDWNGEEQLEVIKKDTIAKVAGRHVLAFLSGGKDSSILASLLKSIFPREKLVFVYVKGLDPETALKNVKLADENVVIVNAQRRFFNALKGVYDPEEKRKVIGKIFVQIWKEQVKKLARELNISQEDFVLAQGTIYPDIIESGGSKHADTIKSHHNRVKEIQEMLMVGSVIEPFSKLFKPNVKKIGEMLGVDRRLITQHPRPGPSGAIRVVCSESPKLSPENLLTRAVSAEKDIQAISKAYEYDAWLLPIKAKGVQGDEGTYAYTIGLIGEYKRNELLELANMIPSNFKGLINRVVYVASPRETTYLGLVGLRRCAFNRETKAIADKADAILAKNLLFANIYNSVSQAFVAILPLTFDERGYSAVIRAVDTDDFMTASCHWLPAQFLERVSDEIIQKIPQIQLVLYDLTSKPPGTIEWE